MQDYGDNKYEVREKLLWWQEQGLSQTTSGYGDKLLTVYQIKDEGRWKRVYCRCFSNIGTCYFLRRGRRIVVS